MRYIGSIALALVMLLTATCLAESILPALSDPRPEAEAQEEVMMPSLEQVSWYDHDSFKKNEDGRLVYHYSRVSENAYQSLGAAMAEAGYALKDSTTDENGDLCFLAGDDAVEMEIVYHGVGGDMDIYYPENAMLETRDEEALTVHLALGEPFLITDECSYALECVKAVDQYTEIYSSGFPKATRHERTQESTETQQYVVFGYSCHNTTAYDVEASRLVGERHHDKEGFSYSSKLSTWSNADFSLSNDLASNTVAGGDVGYYVQVICYDPTLCKGQIPMSVSFMGEDKLMKYVYDVVIGG